jgi:hypothetical protein
MKKILFIIISFLFFLKVNGQPFAGDPTQYDSLTVLGVGKIYFIVDNWEDYPDSITTNSISLWRLYNLMTNNSWEWIAAQTFNGKVSIEDSLTIPVFASAQAPDNTLEGRLYISEADSSLRFQFNIGGVSVERVLTPAAGGFAEIDQSANYVWTGNHNFDGATDFDGANDFSGGDVKLPIESTAATGSFMDLEYQIYVANDVNKILVKRREEIEPEVFLSYNDWIPFVSDLDSLVVSLDSNQTVGGDKDFTGTTTFTGNINVNGTNNDYVGYNDFSNADELVIPETGTTPTGSFSDTEHSIVYDNSTEKISFKNYFPSGLSTLDEVTIRRTDNENRTDTITATIDIGTGFNKFYIDKSAGGTDTITVQNTYDEYLSNAYSKDFDVYVMGSGSTGLIDFQYSGNTEKFTFWIDTAFTNYFDDQLEIFELSFLDTTSMFIKHNGSVTNYIIAPEGHLTDGTGTAGDPYQVWNAADLDSIRNITVFPYNFNTTTANQLHFKQMTDIDLSSYSVWAPIGVDTGTVEAPAGSIVGIWGNHYDGNGYTIRNITLKPYTVNGVPLFFAGLFGRVGRTTYPTDMFENITLENVTIENYGVSIVGNSSTLGASGLCAGALVAETNYNVYNTSDSTGFTNIVVNNLSIDLTASGTFPSFGVIIGGVSGGQMGVTGSYTHIYKQCRVEGTITTHVSGVSSPISQAAGGIAGNAWAGFYECSFDGDMISDGIINGGIAGVIESASGSLAGDMVNCYVRIGRMITADLTNAKQGGLMGYQRFVNTDDNFDYSYAVVDSMSTFTITNNDGLILGISSTGANIVTYALADSQASATIKYASGNPVSQDFTGSLQTTSNMKNEGLLSGWGFDFTNVWGISVGKNDGYPYLLWEDGE